MGGFWGVWGGFWGFVGGFGGLEGGWGSFVLGGHGELLPLLATRLVGWLAGGLGGQVGSSTQAPVAANKRQGCLQARG